MLNRNRTLVAGLCLAALTLAAQDTAFAEGHIEVRLSTPAVRDALHPAIVVVRIENIGDEPVSIMKWDTPFVESGGRLPRSMFEVTDEAGSEVPYRGTWVNLGRLTMGSFKTIYPGEVLDKNVDLALEYRFQANATYKIKYVLPLDREPDPDVVSAAERAPFIQPVQASASSGIVSIAFADFVGSAQKSMADDELMCDAQQKDTIARARLAMSYRLTAAESFMRARYVGTLEDGEVHYIFKPHQRYARWFGTHDDSEPEIYSDGWGLNNNARVFETIAATVKRALSAEQNFKCGCPGFGPDTPAHVETESKYTTYFCEKFFKLPQFDAFGSQIGTLAHEYTHFDALYPGTADYGYGRQLAEKFAREDRAKAVRNADNFEFFITDTTPYED
ncbi:M35 family metallo-endopeptidase [Luteibacter sp. dw_328]|uniref:M35 family metallo-endopeptidase n=1 Tax=Luteibacter sp. dw_328 TaxID=2719796 RepID=UPI001BD5F59F